MNRRTKFIILLILLYLLYRYLKNAPDSVDPPDPPDPPDPTIPYCTTNYSSTNCDTKLSLGELSNFTGRPANVQKTFVNTWANQNPSARIDSVKWFYYGKSPQASGYYLQKSDYKKVRNSCVVTEDPDAYPTIYMYFNRIFAQGGGNPNSTVNNLGKPNVYPTPYFYTWKDLIDYLNNNAQFAVNTPINYSDTYQTVNNILSTEVQGGFNIQFQHKMCECIGTTNCVEL